MPPAEQQIELSSAPANFMHQAVRGLRILAVGGAAAYLSSCGGTPQSVEATGPNTTPVAPTTTGEITTTNSTPDTTVDVNHVEMPTTEATGPNAIRMLDLRTVLLEPGSCDDDSVEWADHINQGTGTQDNGSHFSYINYVGSPAFGDVTGDGNEEQIITVKCDPGNGNPVSYYPQVFTLNHGKAEQIGTLVPPAFKGAVTVEPAVINVTDQKVYIKEWLYAKGDKPDHSSATGYVIFTREGNGFTAEDVTGAEGTTRTDWGTAANTGSEQEKAPITDLTITENGVGKVELGMTLGELKAQGMTETPGCGQISGLENTPMGLSVVIKAGKVEQVQFSDGNFRTAKPKNIGIGSSLEDVQDAYPETKVTHEVDDTGAKFDLARIDMGEDDLLFAVVDGEVKLGAVTPEDGILVLC